MQFDCAGILKGTKGEDYAHEYDEYLDFFRMLGHASAPITCLNVPRQWVPMVKHLGHTVESVAPFFDLALDGLDWGVAYDQATDPRRVVEVASTCRPELVHALYCADTEWPCRLRKHELKKEFVVTCNGSFFRPEVETYRQLLRGFNPESNCAVLVPCAAAKPYPAPLHRAVLERLPKHAPGKWHVIIATGVLGLIPQELWDYAPHYDSGVPYIDRVVQTVRWYFTKHRYQKLVVFSDFYAYAIRLGLSQLLDKPNVRYVFGSDYRDTYENTTLMEHLDRLEVALLA